MADVSKLFVVQDSITGRFSPERLTWEQAQERAGEFDTVRRLDEVLEETGRTLSDDIKRGAHQLKRHEMGGS